MASNRRGLARGRLPGCTPEMTVAADRNDVSGVYRLLNRPWGYTFLMIASRAGAGRREFFKRHADIPAGSRVLEIGCGHGKNIEYMPEGVEYTGCDPNPEYIQHAQDRYSTQGRFLCLSAEDFAQHRLGEFDIVLVVSVLHHLDDTQVLALAAGARAALRAGGRLLVWEPCWTPSQGWVDRIMLSLDRGRFVRTADGYSVLLGRSFGSIHTRFLMTPKILWPQSGCILRASTSCAG